MKYMILLYGSQQAYDAMAGKAPDTASLSPEDFAPMYAFMESWNNELIETGEFVDAPEAATTHERAACRCLEELADYGSVITNG